MEDDEHKAQFNVKECFSIEGCKHLLFGREKLSLKKWQELRLWVLLVDVNTKPKLKTQGSQPKKQDNVATLVFTRLKEEKDPKRWQWLLQEWNMKKIWTEAYQRREGSEAVAVAATRMEYEENMDRRLSKVFLIRGYTTLSSLMASGSFGVGEREA
ncbi:hypothetical protein Tco_0513695 [Tanacetum coccineum]